MLNIDGDQISIAIDLDQGGRLASLQWKDLQFATPFNGDILTWGWYAMAPWVGRIKDGILTNSKKEIIQLPTTYMPPHAIHGFGFSSSWQDIGNGQQLLQLPDPYHSASVIQRFEILDDALRWSLEYEAGNCELPFSLGFHPVIARDIGRGDSAELDFRANKIMVRDSDFVLTGEYLPQPPQPWDDTFVEIISTPTIIWPGAAKLTVESDAPFWTIYTEDEFGICIEPSSAPPNAHLLGISGENYIEALFTFSEEIF